MNNQTLNVNRSISQLKIDPDLTCTQSFSRPTFKNCRSSPTLIPRLSSATMHNGFAPQNFVNQRTSLLSQPNQFPQQLAPPTPRTIVSSARPSLYSQRKSGAMGASSEQLSAGLCQQNCPSKLLNELIEVLKQENINLKQQNNFLLDKLREVNIKHQDAVRSLGASDAIIKDLKESNKEFKIQVQYLRELSKIKMELCSTNFEQLVGIKSRGGCDHRSTSGCKDFQTGFSQRLADSTPNHNYSGKSMESQTAVYSLSEQDSRLLWELHNQFQALLYKCRIETDNTVRRSIRKQLVDLTYKIKSLRKNGSIGASNGKSNPSTS